MGELETIQSALERTARRRRWARALHGLWNGFLPGAILALLVVSLYHVLPLPSWAVLAAPFIPIPFMLVGLLVGGWRRPALTETARWVDVRQGLQERLSTALEVASAPDAGRWSELVVADAASHAKEIEPRRLVSFKLPKATLWALLALALCAGLGFIPEYRTKGYVQKKADAQNIKNIGRQLTELTRHSLQARPPALELTEKSLEAVTDVGDQLAKKTLTRTEALKDLANVADQLKQQINEMGKDPALQKLQEAARASTGGDSQTAEGLQKQVDALQKQLGTPTGNPEALDKLKHDLEKLQEAAKGMSDKNSPGGTEAERQKLSESLAALSKQMQQMGIQMPQLDQAMDALAANQTDLFLKDLQASLTDLDKLRDMAKSLQQLQQQMDKIGKDLAEQLKNGQPEAAQSTLNKMVQQLQAAHLSPEAMQKLLSEVSKAIDPAGKYGKVADHLKDATKQMQAGDKANASQSLAAAAKELENLAQQMGDAQQLADTLAAMNQASECIGTCQGWMACNKPGYKPGDGKPGTGVGTWGDPNAVWDGQFNDHWDNSGAVRPDVAARGHTDRKPEDKSDAFQPTKVKGQFSPGGQMPSITLKGVSIKGQSKVAYEEAATTAQSDAQSALSQDKVPRAYQSAVRDYFDDLKK